MRPSASQHPAKAVCDLAVMLAEGGQCPGDVAMLRSRPHPISHADWDSIRSCGADAPIDVKWCSCCSVGVEPGVVAGGEFGVVDLSSLESGDGVDGPVEVLRDGLHRDAEGVPSGAQGGDVGGRFGVGQGVIDLACDVSLEAADDVALGQALGGSAGDVVHGGLVAAGHADQDDAVERGVRAPVSAAVDAVSGLLAT